MMMGSALNRLERPMMETQVPSASIKKAEAKVSSAKNMSVTNAEEGNGTPQFHSVRLRALHSRWCGKREQRSRMQARRCWQYVVREVGGELSITI
jgi:hypothetical protein